METHKVIELLEAFSKSNVASLSIKDGSFKLDLNKNSTMAVGEVQSLQQENLTLQEPQLVVKAAEIQEVNSEPVIKEVVEDSNLFEVKSPIVGTFYSAGGPELPDFVKVGDKVKKGDTLCIVEAMKLMNEIESDYEGEIVEICIKNEEMVEYGQVLFKIK